MSLVEICFGVGELAMARVSIFLTFAIKGLGCCFRARFLIFRIFELKLWTCGDKHEET